MADDPQQPRGRFFGRIDAQGRRTLVPQQDNRPDAPVSQALGTFSRASRGAPFRQQPPQVPPQAQQASFTNSRDPGTWQGGGQGAPPQGGQAGVFAEEEPLPQDIPGAYYRQDVNRWIVPGDPHWVREHFEYLLHEGPPGWTGPMPDYTATGDAVRGAPGASMVRTPPQEQELPPGAYYDAQAGHYLIHGHPQWDVRAYEAARQRGETVGAPPTSAVGPRPPGDPPAPGGAPPRRVFQATTGATTGAPAPAKTLAAAAPSVPAEAPAWARGRVAETAPAGRAPGPVDPGTAPMQDPEVLLALRETVERQLTAVEAMTGTLRGLTSQIDALIAAAEPAPRTSESVGDGAAEPTPEGTPEGLPERPPEGPPDEPLAVLPHADPVPPTPDAAA